MLHKQNEKGRTANAKTLPLIQKQPKPLKNRILNLTLMSLVLLTSCSKEFNDVTSLNSFSSPNGQGDSERQAGVITAAEWNDLDNWSFWENIINTDDFKSKPQYWTIFNNNRIAVKVVSSAEKPVVNALLQLKREGTTIFTARTDNRGQAELWADIFQNNPNVDFSKLTIDINNGAHLLSDVKPYKEGTNNIVIPATTVDSKLEIAFVVDATGSMGDELEYLKTELLDVISRIKSANAHSTVLTSAVFYRDKGDEYVTIVSNFTSDNNATVNFISNQRAEGGGDFPEAVHTALDKAVNELQWSTNAKTRILFLLLDAPPHHNTSVISSIQTSLLKSAEKGIKIIPITASGIDKETEFLMRFLAMTTNGTYVFITDDSGIGESHLQASVGEYQVEFLNDLMVRLINKYAE